MDEEKNKLADPIFLRDIFMDDETQSFELLETQYSKAQGQHEDQDWVKQCLSAFREFIGEKNFSNFNIELQVLNKQQNQFCYTIPIHNIIGLCGVSLDFIFYPSSILCLSYLTKQYEQTPYYASNKNIINNLSFFALKQNERINYGAVSVHPCTGLFTYKTYTTFSPIEQYCFDSSKLHYFFEQQYYHHKNQMDKLAPKILYQMNKITNKQLKYCIKNSFNYQQQNEQDKEVQLLTDLKEIVNKKCLGKMTDQEQEQYLQQLPKPRNLPILTPINIIKTENQAQKQNQDSNKGGQQAKGDEKQKGEQLMKEWRSQPAIKGGYSEIRKIQISYQSNNVPQKRFLAVKTDHEMAQDQDKHKVDDELKILQHLAKQSDCKRGEGFIATSYYDPSISGCYFMEYYNNGSLENYVQQKSIVLSLRTKLFILAGVISGIEFMHSKGVAHLDIKQGNILLQKQLIPKICDFGEAQYIKEIRIDKENNSYSMPYAGPELFHKNDIITEAYDIFSFGMLMCQVVFEQYPFEFNPQDTSSLVERFRNHNYAIKRNLIQQLKQGPKKIMKYILKLIYLCLQPKAIARPQPAWLIAAIWKMINYLDMI